MSLNKLMKPDFNKQKFEIVITVGENCQTINVNSLEKGFQPNYQEIIGALEIQKSMMMYDQSGYNRKLAGKSRKV